jgi:hypothetical protein
VEGEGMKKTYQGSCHCGAVRFETDLDLAEGTFRCNCSICFKSRAWLAGVPAASFRLLAGEEKLRDYQFGKRKLHHFFCSACGVRPFSQAPDNGRYAVRVNCLDGVDTKDFVDAPIRYVDMLHDDFKSAPVETRHL